MVLEDRLPLTDMAVRQDVAGQLSVAPISNAVFALLMMADVREAPPECPFFECLLDGEASHLPPRGAALGAVARRMFADAVILVTN